MIGALAVATPSLGVVYWLIRNPRPDEDRTLD